MEFNLVKSAIIYVIIIIITVNNNAAEQLDKMSVFLDNPLENFQHFREKSYVGGTNRLFVLNKDLTINQTVRTCKTSESNCMNRNKILLIDEESNKLIVCGTGNGGLCEVRKADDVETVLEQRSAHLKVSTDFKRPAHFMITKNNLFVVALTFGTGIDARYIKRSNSEIIFTYDYAISTRRLSTFEPVTSSNLQKKALFLEMYLQEDISEYTIYYRSLLQSSGYNYFVTNQKEYVGSSRYISKLGRICQNDTGYSSYTDVFLQCLGNNSNYNLIQQAELIKVKSNPYGSDQLFLGVFRSGNDPEAPSGDSVICMTYLISIDEAIIEANKRHALSCKRDDYKKRYLKEIKGDTCLPDEAHFKERYFKCERLPVYKNVIGNLTVTIEAVYQIREQQEGTITALHGTSVGENNPVVIIGTSTGKVLKFNVQPDGIELYSSTEVDPGSSIQKLHQLDDDTLYVISKRKVFKIMSTTCSELKTCADIMAARNPLCGWCVYERRASRRYDCSNSTNHWLMSHDGCVSMSVEPSSIRVPLPIRQEVTNVTLFVKNLPIKHTGDVYRCRFKRGSKMLGTSEAIAINEADSFMCEAPVVSGHCEVTLELLVHSTSGGDLVLSLSQLMFYECHQFRSCGECVGLEGALCEWCLETATCQTSGLSCPTAIFNMSLCPKLFDDRSRRFLPYGVPTLVTFSVMRLPVVSNKSIVYKCWLPELLFEVSAVEENDSISCILSIPPQEVVVKKDYSVLIRYGSQNGTSAIIDDEFGNIVTAYSCANLAPDCSRCRALNANHYQCGWCSDSGICGVTLSNCTLSTSCPAPNITKINPENGPKKGGTALTIYGSDFGSDLSDVDKIEIGHVLCSLSLNLSKHGSTENGDYSKALPEKLVCITGVSDEAVETAAIVKVTANGLSSKSDVLFSYKRASFKSITPRYGPTSGGTLITVFGNNLGIGNRKVAVNLGDKPCLKPWLYPETPGVVNSTIKCIVTGGYKTNITAITLYIDGTAVVYRKYMSFVFISDPEINSVANDRGFTSGGTNIVIQGTDLDHAHEAKLTVLYDGVTQSERCVIQSSLKVLCTIPEATSKLKQDLASKLQMTLKRASSNDCSDCIKAKAQVLLDGVSREFMLSYFRDPVLHDLPGEHKIVTVESKDNHLVISGEYLTLAASLSDVNVTVGVKRCPVLDLTATTVTCIAPQTRPNPGIPKNLNPEINVTIGNICRLVGYLQYNNNTANSSNLVNIPFISSVCGAVFAIVIFVGTYFICRKYRKMVARLEYLEMDKIEKSKTDPIDDLEDTTETHPGAQSDDGKKERTSTIRKTVRKHKTNAETNASDNTYESIQNRTTSEIHYSRLDGINEEHCGSNLHQQTESEGSRDDQTQEPEDPVYINTEDIQYYTKNI